MDMRATPVSDQATAYEMFRDAVARFPDNAFIHIPAAATKAYGGQSVDWTYGAAAAEIDHLREIYSGAGYGLGHRVATLFENRADFFLHWLALNALGVSVVPVNHEFPVSEMAYLMENSEADLVVALPGHVAVATQAAGMVAAAPPVIACDLEGLPAASKPAKEGVIGPETEAAMLFTSGSTGKPKGCLLSNEYFTFSGAWYRDIGGYLTLRPGQERLLTPLPLVHMNALACSSMGMIATGGCIIQLDRFHPSSWWRTVAESGATGLHYLGVMPAILLSMDEGEWDRAHAVRFGFGAGVNPRHHAPFEERFGFPLVEGWAMTESGSGGCIMATEEPRHVGTSCFGRMPPWLEVRLVDDAGNDVPQGDTGELLVRAKGDNPRRGFFSGYYRNAEATAEAWEGGYLHTGDLVRQGPDGSFHFVDRKKSIIRRSGENISALEVEGVLAQRAEVDAVGAAPVPDEMRGDEVMVAVVPAPGVEPTEAVAEALFEEVYAQLAYYKAPGYVAFVEALPLTPSNKLQRGELKALCRTLAAEGKVFDFTARKKRQKKPA